MYSQWLCWSVDIATSARALNCADPRCCRDVVAPRRTLVDPRDHPRTDETSEGTAIMSRNPNRGRVYRRCGCRNANGTQLGAQCPQLTHRRHGTWAFAVDLPTLDHHRKTLRRSGFPTQAHARAALDRVLSCERAAIHIDDHQTVAEYLDAWLETKQRSLKPTTLARYLDYIRKDLTPALGAIRLEELTHHHIASFVTIQLTAGRGPVTVHRCIATLSSALTDAVRHHRLIHNPARFANIPRPRPRQQTCWSPAQAAAFLRHCAEVGDPLAELYELLMCTGMRKGEALALHWADVDFDNRVLFVRYTLSNINNTTPVFTAPKTRSSQSWIGLSQRAVNALHRQADRQRLRRRRPQLPRPRPGLHPQQRPTTPTRVRAPPPAPARPRRRPAADPRARPTPLRRHHDAVLAGPARHGIQDDAALDDLDHHRDLRPPTPPRRPPSRRRHRHRDHRRREHHPGRMTTTSRPPDDHFGLPIRRITPTSGHRAGGTLAWCDHTATTSRKGSPIAVCSPGCATRRTTL